jgi:hypothetical protein
MIGFGRFLLTFSAQPSQVEPRTKKPVFILSLSYELIRATAASNSTGYIFLGLRVAAIV